MTTAEPNMLKFEHEDHGFCRVMFSRRFEDHKFLYCWQEESRGFYKFYRCSSDGEPSHEVTGFAGVLAKKLTPINPGETQTGRDLNTFLKGE